MSGEVWDLHPLGGAARLTARAIKRRHSDLIKAGLKRRAVIVDDVRSLEALGRGGSNGQALPEIIQRFTPGVVDCARYVEDGCRLFSNLSASLSTFMEATSAEPSAEASM